MLVLPYISINIINPIYIIHLITILYDAIVSLMLIPFSFIRLTTNIIIQPAITIANPDL